LTSVGSDYRLSAFDCQQGYAEVYQFRTQQMNGSSRLWHLPIDGTGVICLLPNLTVT